MEFSVCAEGESVVKDILESSVVRTVVVAVDETVVIT